MRSLPYAHGSFSLPLSSCTAARQLSLLTGREPSDNDWARAAAAAAVRVSHAIYRFSGSEGSFYRVFLLLDRRSGGPNLSGLQSCPISRFLKSEIPRSLCSGLVVLA